MKKTYPLLLSLVLTGATVLATTNTQGSFSFPVETVHGNKTPWTNLEANNNPKNFQFAIVSDRTGGMRKGVFAEAVKDLNLMQPEFVVSIGDLIQGYNHDKKRIDGQWEEFNEMVEQLQMPFFYLTGNHDTSYSDLLDEWDTRYGTSYYCFKYNEVLFIMLNSQLIANYKNRFPGGHEKQLAFVEKTLKEAGSVRWTLVFLHHPFWNLGKNDSTPKEAFDRWLEIEKLLKGRNYTVFTGHTHKFNLSSRKENGMNYITLATTGGGSNLKGISYGRYDHFLWVTMTDEGPVFANLLLDGVLDIHESGE